MNIRSEREIKLMKEAGHINFLAHKEMEKYIRPGITTKELDKKINDFIVSHGGIASCYGYEGFPGHACICVNDEVVHGIPGNRRLKDGDIVKLDFTVRKAGYESDMTRTYLVGNVDEKVKEQAKETLEYLGTNFTNVINMLLRQIILTESIPFEVKIPRLNAETKKAMEETEKGIGLSKGYTNLEEMWKDLEKED